MLEDSNFNIRDYFAAHAPEPPEWWVNLQIARDRNANPNNEYHKPKPREHVEILAQWAYEYADAMLKIRGVR